MKLITNLLITTLAGFLCAITLHADEHAVFHFKGSNDFETIKGVLVLNRSVERITTADGYRFATPVDFLHYTVTDASGTLATFTLVPENPNVLTITKGPGGSTAFRLVVEPVPTDPPFPGPLAFTMDFSFSGAAPWGDTVPDRSIEGAAELILGASDLYGQSVCVVEVSINELARQLGALNADLRRIRKSLAQGSKN